MALKDTMPASASRADRDEFRDLKGTVTPDLLPLLELGDQKV